MRSLPRKMALPKFPSNSERPVNGQHRFWDAYFALYMRRPQIGCRPQAAKKLI